MTPPARNGRAAILFMALSSLIACRSSRAHIASCESSPTSSRVAATVTVVDFDGTEHPRLSGEGRLTMWTGSEAGNERFTFAEGRFSFDRSDGCRSVWLDTCVVNGQELVCKGSAITLPSADMLEFRPRRPPSWLLHVVDRETRQELTGVHALIADEYFLEHPGRSGGERLTTNARSPVLVSRRLGPHGPRAECWVSAAGYAWRRVELDLDRVDEQVVELERAGSLEVRVTGEPVPEGAALRLYRAGTKTPHAELYPRVDVADTIEGLLPGEYRLAVEKGDSWQDPLVIARGAVDVAVGELVRTDLRIE